MYSIPDFMIMKMNRCQITSVVPGSMIINVAMAIIDTIFRSTMVMSFYHNVFVVVVPVVSMFVVFPLRRVLPVFVILVGMT